jgi:hypothetical protein
MRRALRRGTSSGSVKAGGGFSLGCTRSHAGRAAGLVRRARRSQATGRLRRTAARPQCRISDRFACITTHSRAQKNRSGCSTAGGWGTSQTPETAPRLGRCPGVSRSGDSFRVPTASERAGEPGLCHPTTDRATRPRTAHLTHGADSTAPFLRALDGDVPRSVAARPEIAPLFEVILNR